LEPLLKAGHVNSSRMNIIEHIQRNKSRYAMIMISAIVLALSTKGITDESNIAMNGDMQKYLMNGAFFHDLIMDLPFTDPMGYAYKYFARYPAISLGHHPILLGLTEVPFYSFFGVSVFSARLTIVFFMLVAAIAWFLLVKQVYDETIACLSSLLFITTPYIVEYSRIVMTEIPTLALIIVTIYFFYRYIESDNEKYIFASAVSLSLSVYSKYAAIFLFPVLLFYFLIRKGLLKLVKKEVLISCLLMGLLLLPLVFITLKFSHSNLEESIKWTSSALSLKNAPTSNVQSNKFLFYVNALWKHHITIPVLVLSIISIVVSLYKRDRKTIMFFLWLVVFYLMVTNVGWKLPRYGVFWIPVYCLFAATTIKFYQSPVWKKVIATAIIIICGYQFSVSFQMKPAYAIGYEDAAQYVVDNKRGESILYSSRYDTGYFIFFMRKHNPDNDMIVLRADKILATSKMNRLVNNRIDNRADVYDILKKYGVRYVIIGDKGYVGTAIRWLQEEVETDEFILRKEIVLQSNERKINNMPLAIYEYKGYSQPKKGEILDMQIPLMGDSIQVLFEDLLSVK